MAYYAIARLLGGVTGVVLIALPFLMFAFDPLFPFLFNVLAGLLVTLVEAPFCCNCIKCCVDCAERITCLKSGTLRAPIFSCLCGLGLYLDLTMNQSAFFVITHIALGVSGGLYVASACFSKEGEDYSMVDGETKV